MGILSWLKPKGSAAPLPGDRVVPVSAPAVSAPAPVTTPGWRSAEVNSAVLLSYLQAEVAGAVAEIRASVVAGPDAEDSLRLLDDLGGEIEHTIRRPPLAAQQALSACRDPNISLGEILESFHQDPALTQALLKHANSPFYAAGGPVSSLHEAAQRVGLSGLHSVLLGAILEGLLCRPGGDLGTMVQQIWTHMVRTAPAARRLARVAKVPPETAYTLGLLHDLGKLIIFDRLTAQRAATRHTARVAPGFLTTLLARVHGPLGGIAALAWNLDAEAARAIASHPRQGIRYRDERMSQVLAIAEWADLTTIRDQPRDYEALWERAGLDLDLDQCRAALEDGR
jgi:HD-like signal output (HDOD) protein